ncbi:MAG: hypothetical protein JHC85_08570 [Chthoniobacterales bacterium]|nr:hypothetical protein [Chthoniobacterales bacterium]
MEAATGETPPSLDLMFLLKTKKPQTIRVKFPPVDTHRKRRVIALQENAVEGSAATDTTPNPSCSVPGSKISMNAWRGCRG